MNDPPQPAKEILTTIKREDPTTSSSAVQTVLARRHERILASWRHQRQRYPHKKFFIDLCDSSSGSEDSDSPNSNDYDDDDDCLAEPDSDYDEDEHPKISTTNNHRSGDTAQRTRAKVSSKRKSFSHQQHRSSTKHTRKKRKHSTPRERHFSSRKHSPTTTFAQTTVRARTSPTSSSSTAQKKTLTAPPDPVTHNNNSKSKRPSSAIDALPPTSAVRLQQFFTKKPPPPPPEIISLLTSSSSEDEADNPQEEDVPDYSRTTRHQISSKQNNPLPTRMIAPCSRRTEKSFSPPSGSSNHTFTTSSPHKDPSSGRSPMQSQQPFPKPITFCAAASFTPTASRLRRVPFQGRSKRALQQQQQRPEEQSHDGV